MKRIIALLLPLISLAVSASEGAAEPSSSGPAAPIEIPGTDEHGAAADPAQLTAEITPILRQLLDDQAGQELLTNELKESARDAWMQSLQKAADKAGIGDEMQEILDEAGPQRDDESAPAQDARDPVNQLLDPNPIQTASRIEPSQNLQPSAGIEGASGLDQPGGLNINTDGFHKSTDAEWRATFPKKETADTK